MVHLKGEGAPAALQKLAREQMKHKLLADILTDMSVCEIEGWDQAEYLRDLHDVIARFHPCERRHSEMP